MATEEVASSLDQAHLVEGDRFSIRRFRWQREVDPLDDINSDIQGFSQQASVQQARTGQLDELFALARQYRNGRDFQELLEFVRRFRNYAPFNAMLLNIQMRGATYVAPASRWWNDWKRKIVPGSRPLVVLQPMGPVMFVFDVSHTEPAEGAPALPTKVVAPFAAEGMLAPGALSLTIQNATRDGVRILLEDSGSQLAGSIRRAQPGTTLDWIQSAKENGKRVERTIKIPVRYELLVNRSADLRTQYATITHELAHLYLGHLGTPDERWWPDRRGRSLEANEFEAESVSWIVCRRLGVDPRSERYLGGYLGKDREIPEVSIDRVMKVSGDIEQMAKGRLQLRKGSIPPN